MVKRSVIVVMWILLSMMLVIAGGPTVLSQADSVESVCYVVDGSLTDWEYIMPGLTHASEELGLEMTYVETNVSYQDGIETCVSDGSDVVITVFDQNSAATAAAAEANPDVYFVAVEQVVIDGTLNVQGIVFREDQAGFLAGALAASMSESETVAGVYGIAVPGVVKFRNGFEQGVRYIDPNIEALGVYLDSFADPDGGAAAAAQFISEGADVIFGAGGLTGSGGILYAAQEGVLVIGVDGDEYLTTFAEGEMPGAENLLSSAVKQWDTAIYQTLQDLVEGGSDWIGGGNLMMSLENDGVGLAPWHDAGVPEAVQTSLEEIRLGLVDGSIETGVDPLTGDLMEEASASESATGNAAQAALLAALSPHHDK